MIWLNFAKIQDIVGWKKANIYNEKTYLKSIPFFTVDDLREFCCGPYALKLAKQYIKHSHNLAFYVHIDKSYKHIIKVSGIQSRFSSIKQYSVFIYFDYSSNSNNLLLDCLTCCTCKSGLRSIGACAHVVTALYYIGQKVNNFKEIEFNSGTSLHINTLTNISSFVKEIKNKKRRIEK